MRSSEGSRPERALPSDERPFDYTPVSLSELPETPTRDRNIAATAWDEAPPVLLGLGENLEGRPEAAFKRRIFGWLLWRAGPTRGPCRYLALNPTDSTIFYIFEVRAEHAGGGKGPDGEWHSRFRAWKEALRAAPLV